MYTVGVVTTGVDHWTGLGHLALRLLKGESYFKNDVDSEGN